LKPQWPEPSASSGPNRAFPYEKNRMRQSVVGQKASDRQPIFVSLMRQRERNPVLLNKANSLAGWRRFQFSTRGRYRPGRYIDLAVYSNRASPIEEERIHKDLHRYLQYRDQLKLDHDLGRRTCRANVPWQIRMRVLVFLYGRARYSEMTFRDLMIWTTSISALACPFTSVKRVASVIRRKSRALYDRVMRFRRIDFPAVLQATLALKS
jgi:predicted nucleotidyltransferase